MSDNSEKASPSNGLGTDPQQRLASFKPPRDLTLGGVKPNKKVFTPNLNVARNKNKGPAANTARDQRRDDKGKRDRKNDRNRHLKNGPNIIKSSGVFSEGLGAVERQSGRFSHGGGRAGEPAPALQRPTIRVKDVIKIDKELEEQKIRGVMGREESDEEADFKPLRERDAPVHLPMDCGVWNKPKPAVQVKQEVIVKNEPGVDADCSIKLGQELSRAVYKDASSAFHMPTPICNVNLRKITAATAVVKKEVFEENDLVNLLQSKESTLILLQLPDSLPGRGGASDPEPSTSGETAEDTPVDNRCRLSDLEEGRIGQLRVHRSGRVTLLLGDTVFEVSAGTKPAFHQEAVSVAADDASRSANIISLGQLQHKLTLTPQWEAMFSDMQV